MFFSVLWVVLAAIWFGIGLLMAVGAAFDPELPQIEPWAVWAVVMMALIALVALT